MKRRLLILCLLAVFVFGCLGLSGCTFKNETLDQQMSLVVAALNEGDEAAFAALLYPGMEEEYDLQALFDQMEGYWEPVAPEELSLVSFHIRKGTAGNISEGMYTVPGNEKINSLQLVYVENEEGRGLSTVYLQQWDEQEADGAGKSTPEWILTGLCVAFLILTIVDVLVKKPRKYGWYVVLALFFFTFTLHLNESSFGLSLPIGAIVYWCMRGKLLREKAKLAAATLSSAAISPEDPGADTEETGES